jgi:uncharacterized protein YqcC (DUF446 family)
MFERDGIFVFLSFLIAVLHLREPSKFDASAPVLKVTEPFYYAGTFFERWCRWVDLPRMEETTTTLG